MKQMSGAAMVRVLACLAVCGLATFASAQTVSAPHLRISVEQPVYAGLPVWLDIETDDPCIAAHYEGDLAGIATGGAAQVVDSGGKPVARAVPLLEYVQSQPARQAGACPNYDPSDAQPYFRPRAFPPGRLPPPVAPGPARVPLHLVAGLRRPGQYAVRWAAPFTNKLGHLDPTPWLKFVVQPSSARQRDAWLAGLLAHVPTDDDDIKRRYVPSLLAAWDDPRVIHKVIDFLCSDDHWLSPAMMAALGPPLSENTLRYLTKSVAGGCLSEGLQYYVNTAVANFGRPSAMPDQGRRRLLLAVTEALPRARGAHIARALNMLLYLRGGRQDAAEAMAERAVLRDLPRIVSVEDGSSIEEPKWVLANYAVTFANAADRRTVLRALAAQQDPAAGYATAQLIHQGNQDDIPFLRDRLMGPVDALSFDHDDLQFALRDMIRKYGPDGISLVHTLAHAESAQVRSEADIVLALQGERQPIERLLAVLQGQDGVARTALVLRLLGSPACEHADCSWASGRDGTEMDSDNLSTLATLVAYFQARRAAAP